ncbi:hypothetical protein L1987_77871 [Smallanthus sonchifolius]|uniref:Uncharacterized protein n=1 Tax=Smallanthus sonchifolius TaxID=185202 RepID=A0ACB8ZA78_9ASTR|nr:hypothetical protein L1987_77871 [Smallanthus sonchifolius]
MDVLGNEPVIENMGCKKIEKLNDYDTSSFSIGLTQLGDDDEGYGYIDAWEVMQESVETRDSMKQKRAESMQKLENEVVIEGESGRGQITEGLVCAILEAYETPQNR